MDDDLEAFLATQHSDGVTDSTGTFTLSAAQSLEKLAKYSLPWEHAWILKMLQAVVAKGASLLEIHVTDKYTEFRFRGAAPWPLEQVEAALFAAETLAERGLEHLKRGAWSCLHNNRTLLYTPADSTEGLFLTREKCQRIKIKTRAQCSLKISHGQPHSVGQILTMGVVPGPGAEAFANLAPVLKELDRHAYACPIPVLAGARRFDNLLLSPTHGYPRYGCIPLGFFPFPGELPQLRFSARAVEAPAAKSDPLAVACSQRNYFITRLDTAAHCAVGCLLSLKIEDPSSTQFFSYCSQIHCVLDGVIVHSQPIGKTTYVSAAIYLSAEGLPTDLSGLKLVEGDAFKERIGRAVQIVDRELKTLDIPTPKMRPDGGKLVRVVSRVGLGASLVCALSFPLILMAGAACLLGVAYYDPSVNVKGWKKQDEEQKAELPKFKRAWRNLMDGKVDPLNG